MTFAGLTGQTGYALVMVQLAGSATDETVAAIRAAAGETYAVRDKREQQTAGTYLAFVACVYAFQGILTLVTVLNIINSIAMSVSAREHQYGAMRAVGMDGRQIAKMITAEAGTYAFCGGAVGCAIGLPLHRLLYALLIGRHFAYAVWTVPAIPLAMILLLVVLAAGAAAWAPARHVCALSVTRVMQAL